MSSGYVIPFVLGIAIYYFAEDIIDVRRFGPITEDSRASETGGLAFRVVGLVLISVGILKFLQTYLAW